MSDLDTDIDRLLTRIHENRQHDPEAHVCKLSEVTLEFDSIDGIAHCIRPGVEIGEEWKTWCVRCNDTMHEILYPIPMDERGYPLPPKPCPGARRERGIRLYNLAGIPGRLTGYTGSHNANPMWLTGPLDRCHEQLARIAGWHALERQHTVQWVRLADALRGWEPRVADTLGTPNVLILDDLAAIMSAHSDRCAELAAALERYRSYPRGRLFVASELTDIKGCYHVGRLLSIIRAMCGVPQKVGR